MTDQVQAQTPEKAKREPNPNIISGRAPAVIVYLMRYGNSKDQTVAEQAKLFGTTTGKIAYVRSGNGFGYIAEDDKFTQAQLDEGVAYMKRHPAYDEANADRVVNEIELLPVASAEEAAAYEAKRVAARGTSTTKKDGTPADGGGGNRRGRKPKAEKTVEAPADAPSADELLDA